MVQTAINTFYNGEQEKEAKAQEKERKKETRHAQMLATLQRSPMANPAQLEMRPSSNAPNPVESREAPPTSSFPDFSEPP